MSIANDIKCARCDRKYSGVRSRCPYCGARRIGRGKYTEDSDNAKGKMLISVLICAVFAVGVGILLLTNPVEADAGGSGNDSAIEEPDEEEEDDDPLLELVVDDPIEPPDEIPDDIIIPVEITSLIIIYGQSPLRDNEFTLRTTENVIPLNFRVEPPGAESGLEVRWWSEDTDVAEITVVPGIGGQPGVEVNAVGVGNTRIYVKVGDVETSCIVRVPR